MNASFNRIHQTDSTFVAYIVELVQPVEVKQIHVAILKTHYYSRRIRDGVVGFLHNHIFQLTHQITLLGLFRIVSHHTSYDDIRMKILIYHIGREIVVNASVIHQYTVYLNGLKNKRKAHRGTHSIPQIPGTHYQRAFVVDIRRHAPERYKQVIEVSLTRSCSLPKQNHKSQVHLDGVYHIGRNFRFHLIRPAERKAEIEKFWRRTVMFEIVSIFRLNGSRIPLLKVWRTQQFLHFIGRISHCIQRTDNGPHRSTGYIIDGNIVFFEGADNSDMGHPLGTTSAQHQAYTLSLYSRKQAENHQCPE